MSRWDIVEAGSRSHLVPAHFGAVVDSESNYGYTLWSRLVQLQSIHKVWKAIAKDGRALAHADPELKKDKEAGIFQGALQSRNVVSVRV